MSKTPMYLCKCNSCSCMFMAYGRGEPLCKQCREAAMLAAKAKGGRDVSTKPKRAFRLTLMLDADTRSDMADALRRMADDVEREAMTAGFYGSPSDGAIYELLHDPAMSHDAYHAALRDYLAAKAKGE